VASDGLFYRRVVLGYVVLVAVGSIASAVAGVSVPATILMGATGAMLLLSLLAIRHRLPDTGVSARAPIPAALLASLGTLIFLHVTGVPPQYARALAVLVFGLAAYPFVRGISDEIPPFPLYCGLWVAAAAGMLLWSHASL
jgi:hypothetical protein